MFGIPKELSEDFLKAWKEPFHGVELSWLEIEICRSAMDNISIGNLFEKLSNQYKLVEELHQSKFYRVVNNLVDNKYLSATSEGRSKLVRSTPKGFQEVGRLTRYLMEFQLDRIKHELWVDLINKITPITGCLLDQKVVIVGPEAQAVESLLKVCRNCEYAIDSNNDNETIYLNVTFLDFNAALGSKNPKHTVQQIDSLGDWPYKDDYADIIIELTALSVFNDMSLIQEAKRVVKPQGYLVFFEIVEMKSIIASQLLREISQLQYLSDPTSKWHFPEQPLTDEDIQSIVVNEDLQVVKTFNDIINTIIIALK